MDELYTSLNQLILKPLDKTEPLKLNELEHLYHLISAQLSCLIAIYDKDAEMMKDEKLLSDLLSNIQKIAWQLIQPHARNERTAEFFKELYNKFEVFIRQQKLRDKEEFQKRIDKLMTIKSHPLTLRISEIKSEEKKPPIQYPQLIENIRHLINQALKEESNPLNFENLLLNVRIFFDEIVTRHYLIIEKEFKDQFQSIASDEDYKRMLEAIEKRCYAWSEYGLYRLISRLLTNIVQQGYQKLQNPKGVDLKYRVLELLVESEQLRTKTIDPISTSCVILKPFLFYIKEFREELKKIRDQIPEILHPKDKPEARVEITRSLISDIHNAEKALSTSLIKLTEKLFNHCLLFLPKSPTSLAVFALGSLSFQSATPFSDIEYGLLYENENPWDQDFLKCFHVLIELMGETKLTTEIEESHSKYNKKNDYVGAGFHVDEGMHPLTALKDGVRRLQGNIESITHWLVDSKDQEEVIYPDDRVNYALQHPTLLFTLKGEGSSLTGQELFNEFAKNILIKKHEKYISSGQLYPLLENRAWHEVRSLAFLKSLNKDLMDSQKSMESDKEKFSLKKQFYVPIKYWLMHLAHYFNLSYETIPEVITILLNNHKISQEYADDLRFALAVITAIRYRAQLHYGHQKGEEYVIMPTIEDPDNYHYRLSESEFKSLQIINRIILKPLCILLKKWQVSIVGQINPHHQSAVNQLIDTLNDLSQFDPSTFLIQVLIKKVDAKPLEKPIEEEKNIIEAFILTKLRRLNISLAGDELLKDYHEAIADFRSDQITHIISIIRNTQLSDRQKMGLWIWSNVTRWSDQKPIAYIALGLRFYFSLKADNLEGIFIEAAEKNILSEELGNFYLNIFSLNEKVLSQSEQYRLDYFTSFLKFLQGSVEFHLQNFKDESYKPAEFKLDKVVDAYLHHRLSLAIKPEDYEQWFIQVTQFLLYIHAPLHRHRYYYRQLPDPYRMPCINAAKDYIEKAKDTYWKQDNEFWEILWDAPLSNGARPSHLLREDEWKKSLTSLFTTEDKINEEKIKVYITSLQLQKITALLPNIVSIFLKGQWIDAEGKFVQKSNHPIAKRMAGNHLVIPWPLPENIDILLKAKEEEIDETLKKIYENAKFYFKIFPEYPLVELFINDLSRRLGYYHPRNVDLWRWKSGRFDYPILISEAVSGEALKDLLEGDEELKFDELAFSQSLVVSGLLSLEDNNPSNVMTGIEKNGKRRLYLIDADHWFVPPFKDNKLHAKDIIFCLSAMAKAVDPLYQEEFLSLNPHHVLHSWVVNMKQLALFCIHFFESKIEDYFYKARCEEEKTLLLPPLKWYAVHELFNEMQNIQAVFGRSVSHKISITHYELLAQINSRLANHFLLIAQKGLKALDQFNGVAGYAYQKGRGDRIEYYSSKIDFVTRRQDLWEGFSTSGNTQKDWERDIENTRQQLEGLTETSEEILKAKEELQNDNIQRFKNLSQRGKEKLLSELKWSALKTETQRKLLDEMKNQGQYLNIIIQHSGVVDDNDLRLLIQKSHGLKRLKLISCPQLTYSFWSGLPPTDSLLKVIHIEGLKNLKYMGSLAVWFFGEQCLELPNLEKLTIKNCESLEEINIYAKQLKNVYLVNLSALKILQTQSQALKNLHLIETTLPLNKTHKVLDRYYAESLDIFEWKSKNSEEKKIIKLFVQFPILLCINWDKYEISLIEKFISQLNQIVKGKSIYYLKISSPLRKKVLTQTESLLHQFNILTKPEVIAVLIQAMQSSEGGLKAQAAAALGNLKEVTHEVIVTLLKALGNSDWSAKTQATSVLGNLQQSTPEVISILIKALGDSDWDVREKAASVLGNLKQPTPEVIIAFINALKDSDWRVRPQAAFALGNLKQATPKVIDALKEVLNKDSFWYVRTQAASALIKLGQEPPEAIAFLIKQLESGSGPWDADVRAASALMNLKKATPLVITARSEALEDKDSDVRTPTASTLENLKQATPRVIAVINDALGDENVYTRTQAVSKLGNLKPMTPEVIAALIKALRDENVYVKIEAASALRNQAKKLAQQMDNLFAEFLTDKYLILPEAKPGSKITPASKFLLFGDPTSKMLISIKQWENILKESKDKKEQLTKQAIRYGYKCLDVLGDGNCFFHAMAHQLKLPHDQLRARVVDHILKHFDAYKDFSVDESPDQFILRMTKDRSWVDHIMVLALSREFNITLVIIQSDGKKPIIIQQANPIERIVLGYEVDVHYQVLLREESLVPEAGCNIEELIKRPEDDNISEKKISSAEDGFNL